MYSTYKNIILRRLKYIIAGLFLITILPGNARVKNSGHLPGSELDSLIQENIYSLFTPDAHITVEPFKEFTDKVSNSEGEIKSDTVKLYVHQAREMSPVARSNNFFLIVQ